MPKKMYYTTAASPATASSPAHFPLMLQATPRSPSCWALPLGSTKTFFPRTQNKNKTKTDFVRSCSLPFESNIGGGGSGKEPPPSALRPLSVRTTEHAPNFWELREKQKRTPTSLFGSFPAACIPTNTQAHKLTHLTMHTQDQLPQHAPGHPPPSPPENSLPNTLCNNAFPPKVMTAQSFPTVLSTIFTTYSNHFRKASIIPPPQLQPFPAD